ncbi:GNAT family N-acetyltransferase [Niabella beijingensis]|uniref:GNAT family N-acetyltransferase n=1 Tax=Niabella beijingensis TaxID=2872700 RepID=UPI001CBFC825|nr:GNAT family N-acetyltransferase [Niabella beijingensis]MBZ4188334.1 GNAT family N-acetyltransferase [Niabella beijingensis]
MASLTLLETERLILRPTEEADATFLFYLMNSPKWLKYIGNREITSVEKARNYILQRIRPQQARAGFGSFTVIRKTDHKRMGTCGLYQRENLTAPDIGFAFLPRFEHRGYAFEAAQKVIEAGFSILKLERILAITAPDNTGSQRLLQKLGLHPAGTVLLRGDKEACCLFELQKNPLVHSLPQTTQTLSPSHPV